MRAQTRPEGLDSIETASVDELRALQLQRMQWSVRHAYDNVVPFRLKCEAQGVSPDALQRLEDINLFPFTLKDDLREHYPLFTTLSREALPMIRYRTRDLTRLLPPSARTMPRMDKITGRSDDMLIIRGVNVFPSQVEELLLKVKGLAPHYQLVVDRDNNRDNLTVLVECREGQSDNTHAALGEKLQLQIKSYTGVNAKVDILSPGGVERSQGKAKRVIDKRYISA